MSFLTLPVLIIILLAFVVLSLFGALAAHLAKERLNIIPKVLSELLDIDVRTMIQGVIRCRRLVLWYRFRFFNWVRVLVGRGMVSDGL